MRKKKRQPSTFEKRIIKLFRYHNFITTTVTFCLLTRWWVRGTMKSLPVMHRVMWWELMWPAVPRPGPCHLWLLSSSFRCPLHLVRYQGVRNQGWLSRSRCDREIGHRFHGSAGVVNEYYVLCVSDVCFTGCFTAVIDPLLWLSCLIKHVVNYKLQ